MIGDVRLSLEVAVITAMARRILGLIKMRDPLSENVHLTRIGAMGGVVTGVASGLLARFGRGGLASHQARDA
ncbi:MAG: squalene synthase HpnC, partial [Alphaproteobacteria bacterium]|nr:squalene synthase HpnC [Alphaproteobacteria bacterium]